MSHTYRALYEYLGDCDLDAGLGEATRLDGVGSFSNYFREYKFQKVTNTLYDDFLSVVNKEGEKRTYNSVFYPRSKVVDKLDKGAGSRLFLLTHLVRSIVHIYWRGCVICN